MKILRKMSHSVTKSVGTAGFALLLIGATGGALAATAPVANAATNFASSPRSIAGAIPNKTVKVIEKVCIGSFCLSWSITVIVKK